jgi:hypothetical protein
VSELVRVCTCTGMEHERGAYQTFESIIQGIMRARTGAWQCILFFCAACVFKICAGADLSDGFRRGKVCAVGAGYMSTGG